MPYQTRIMGAEIFGKLNVAAAIMMYFQLLMDFGFILSAVAKISRHRDDPQVLSKVLTCVTWAKALFFAVSLLVVELCISPGLEDNSMRLMYFFYLLATGTNSFLPDYMYKGLERMSIITVRTVLIKLFFTAMIFFVPAYQGTVFSGALVHSHREHRRDCGGVLASHQKDGVHFCRVTVRGSSWRSRSPSGFLSLKSPPPYIPPPTRSFWEAWMPPGRWPEPIPPLRIRSSRRSAT